MKQGKNRSFEFPGQHIFNAPILFVNCYEKFTKLCLARLKISSENKLTMQLKPSSFYVIIVQIQ